MGFEGGPCKRLYMASKGGASQKNMVYKGGVTKKKALKLSSK